MWEHTQGDNCVTTCAAVEEASGRGCPQRNSAAGGKPALDLFHALRPKPAGTQELHRHRLMRRAGLEGLANKMDTVLSKLHGVGWLQARRSQGSGLLTVDPRQMVSAASYCRALVRLLITQDSSTINPQIVLADRKFGL